MLMRDEIRNKARDLSYVYNLLKKLPKIIILGNLHSSQKLSCQANQIEIINIISTTVSKKVLTKCV